jgi:short-subunit dehydrogenase
MNKRSVYFKMNNVSKPIIAIVLALALLGLLILLKILVYRVEPFVDQYIIMQEQDLAKRYSAKDGTWALITGPSSGMGERFAHEFAERGFNLLLIGSKRTKGVVSTIKKTCPKIQIKFIEADFSESFKESFFDPIQKAVDEIGDKWRILINNVGYRTFSLNYEDMPISEMKKTIAVGTLVQSKLMQMAIQTFSKIKSYTAIVNITAQNTIPTDLFAIDKDLTVPHLACYEATNVFGYCHAKSVYAEIKDKYPLIDFLIITPGAVKTKNTEHVLKDVIFSIDVDVFIKNVIKLMGNKNGIYCAYWGHSLSGALINIFPFFDSNSVMKKIGVDFSNSRKQIN